MAVLLQSSAGDDTPNGYQRRQRVDKARVDSGSGWFRRVASPYSNTGAAPATSSNPDYSWMGVWAISGEDHIRTPTRKYSYRRFLSRSGVEIHLPGETVGLSQYSGGTGVTYLGVRET